MRASVGRWVGAREGVGWASPYVQKKCGKLELLLTTKEKIFRFLELSVGMRLVIEIGFVLAYCMLQIVGNGRLA